MPSEYINVPVPAELVPEVYALIAKRTFLAPVQPQTAPVGAPFSTESWTDEDIAFAVKGASPTMRRFWRVLAESPGVEVNLDMIAERTGVPREGPGGLKGTLSGFGRFHNKYWKGRKWFFEWVFRDDVIWYWVSTRVAAVILASLGDTDLSAQGN